MSRNQSLSLPGIRKAAILLVQLGRDRAATVFSRLPEGVVEELTAEIVRLRDVPMSEADSVLRQAHEELVAKPATTRGGMELARALLSASLGTERAEEILERLGATLAEMPFEAMRRADPRQLLSFLAEEHPQTIALVLAHLSPAQSAVVLSGFDQHLQTEVAYRIALLERASPDVIRIVEQELERRMSTVLGPQEMASIGGVAPLVAIINRADRTTERMILEGLESVDNDLSEQVRSQMFIFDDITTLDDKAIQLVLRSVESGDLALALKGVREEVRDKVLRNLSTRASDNLVEEIDLLGSVRLSQVEEAQAKIVQEIRALEQTGQIVIMRGGDEEYVS
jgi:flagellar motor switch protein FliG